MTFYIQYDAISMVGFTPPPCASHWAKMMQYVNILLLTEFNVIKLTFFQSSLTFIGIYKNVLMISVKFRSFRIQEIDFKHIFWHNSVTKFILHRNINFITLKMHYFRWCGSWCRAGFFSKLIYCCPIQPRPNILSLGVTTISMRERE